MAFLLKFILAPLLTLAFAAWVLWMLAVSFMDDLGGPDDGPGYT